MTACHHPARRLLETAGDAPLSLAAREAVRQHLARCAECRAYQADAAQVEAWLRRALPARWPHRGFPRPHLAHVAQRLERARRRATIWGRAQEAARLFAAASMVVLALAVLGRGRTSPLGSAGPGAAASSPARAATAQPTPSAADATPWPAGSVLAHADLDCDGQGEVLRVARRYTPDAGPVVSGVALEGHVEAPAGPVWTYTPRDARATHFLEPELFSPGGCEQLLGLVSGSGRNHADHTRVFRWDGRAMVSVLDVAGAPAATDLRIGSLPQTPGAPFRVTVQHKRGSALDCRLVTTAYEWDGARFQPAWQQTQPACGTGAGG